MNNKERRELSQGLAKGLTKALKPATVNRQLMRYMSGNSPVFFEDNDEAYVDKGYMYNPDLYSVVNGITQAASSVPFVVNRVVDKKKARQYHRYKSVMKNGATQKQLDRIENIKEEAFEEDQDNDLYRLLERPNPLQAFYEWYENVKGFHLITGNGYTYMNRLESDGGRIAEMWAMPSQWTRILADGGSQELINGYVIELYGHMGDKIESDDVMHWKYWNPDYDSPGSHLYGMSPLRAARDSMKLSNDARQSLSVSLQNGGASGMIYPDGDEFDTLTEKQKSEIKSFWDRNQGPSNAKSALVFTSKMGWKEFGHPPVDLEIIEAAKMSQKDICNVYNYPSILLNNDEGSSYNNYSQARKQLYLDLVIPTLERDYGEMNRHITPNFNRDGREYVIDYDVQAIDAIQQDTSEKTDWLQQAWWMTLDEKRAEMGLEPLGDENLYIPANLIPNTNVDLTEEEIKQLRKDYNA